MNIMALSKGLQLKSDVSQKKFRISQNVLQSPRTGRGTAGTSMTHLQLLHYFGIFLEITKLIFLPYFPLPVTEVLT